MTHKHIKVCEILLYRNSEFPYRSQFLEPTKFKRFVRRQKCCLGFCLLLTQGRSQWEGRGGSNSFCLKDPGPLG